MVIEHLIYHLNIPINTFNHNKHEQWQHHFYASCLFNTCIPHFCTPLAYLIFPFFLNVYARDWFRIENSMPHGIKWRIDKARWKNVRQLILSTRASNYCRNIAIWFCRSCTSYDLIKFPLCVCFFLFLAPSTFHFRIVFASFFYDEVCCNQSTCMKLFGITYEHWTSR